MIFTKMQVPVFCPLRLGPCPAAPAAGLLPFVRRGGARVSNDAAWRVGPTPNPPAAPPVWINPLTDTGPFDAPGVRTNPWPRAPLGGEQTPERPVTFCGVSLRDICSDLRFCVLRTRPQLRENYNSVANGYKDALLDLEATNLAGEDRCRLGAIFESLCRLYDFDKRLRDVTTAVLLDAETAMRTATVYAFCLVLRLNVSFLELWPASLIFGSSQ